mmetsp:Transcript_40240/g.74833  ORF Transcript_40240/g.74833 Transcript_40240/m.74833 type:complete len:168 (+) Transcript_40240:1-504(+)
MQMLTKAYYMTENDKWRGLRRVNDKRGYLVEEVHAPAIGLGNAPIAYHRMFGASKDCCAKCCEILSMDKANKSITVIRHKEKPVIGFQGHSEMKRTPKSTSRATRDIFFSMIDHYKLNCDRPKKKAKVDADKSLLPTCDEPEDEEAESEEEEGKDEYAGAPEDDEWD